MKHPKALAYLAFGIVCFVWGTTYLAIRVGIETLPTFLFAGARFTIAGAVLLFICAWRGEAVPWRWGDWWNMAIAGFCMVGVDNVAVIWAEHHVSSGFAALLVATAPFWMAAMERLLPHGDRVSLRKKIGMTIGFGGVVILVHPFLGGERFNLMFLLGVLVLQLATIIWNFGSIRSKYHPIESSPLMSAAMQMLTGGVMVTAVGLLRGEASQFAFTTRTLIAFSYLVVFGSIIAYTSYVYALAHLPTSTVSLYAYINPVVAVFLGWLILNESIGWNAVVAMVVIIAGVALVQSAPKRHVALVPPLTDSERVVIREPRGAAR